MEIYRDPVTGYEVRRYAEGPERKHVPDTEVGNICQRR